MSDSPHPVACMEFAAERSITPAHHQVPILGEIRYDNLYFLRNKKFLYSISRNSSEFEVILDRYYDGDVPRAQPKPEPPNLAKQILDEANNSDPIFIDPDVDDRLEILGKMISMYNGESPNSWPGIRMPV